MQEAARAQLPDNQLVFSPHAQFLLPLPALPCSCTHSVAEGILQRTAHIRHFEHFILLEIIWEPKINVQKKKLWSFCVFVEDASLWCWEYLSLHEAASKDFAVFLFQFGFAEVDC